LRRFPVHDAKSGAEDLVPSNDRVERSLQRRHVEARSRVPWSGGCANGDEKPANPLLRSDHRASAAVCIA
jgi:hypothetical protein